MPPFVPNTSAVEVPISTSITLSLYFLFFSFSCSLKIIAVYLPWLDRELTCVTHMTKNAVTPAVQKLPAFISGLASRLVTVDWRLNTSLLSGCRSGSVFTFLHTLLMCDVRRSRILHLLIIQDWFAPGEQCTLKREPLNKKRWKCCCSSKATVKKFNYWSQTSQYRIQRGCWPHSITSVSVC